MGLASRSRRRSAVVRIDGRRGDAGWAHVWAVVILTALPDLPRSLVVAGKWWFVAIGAAVFETVLAAAHALITAGLTLPEVLTQVLVRLVVFAAASWLTLQLLQGRNTARVALTVLLSIFGLL